MVCIVACFTSGTIWAPRPSPEGESEASVAELTGAGSMRAGRDKARRSASSILTGEGAAASSCGDVHKLPGADAPLIASDLDGAAAVGITRGGAGEGLGAILCLAIEWNGHAAAAERKCAQRQYRKY